MTTFLVVLHVLVSFFLIAVVLLQRGKGAEMGAVFGGGASSTVFGSRGAGNFLTKLTTASAVIFMTTSLSLSYIWTSQSSDRLFEGDPAALEAPIEEEESPLFEEVPGAGGPSQEAAPETSLFEEAPSPAEPSAVGEPPAGALEGTPDAAALVQEAAELVPEAAEPTAEAPAPDTEPSTP